MFPYLQVYIFTGLHIYRLTYLQVYIFTGLHIYRFTYLQVYIFTGFHIYRFTYLQVYIFTGLYIYSFTYLQVYIFTGLHIFGRLPFWSSSILVVFHFGCDPIEINLLVPFASKDTKYCTGWGCGWLGCNNSNCSSIPC